MFEPAHLDASMNVRGSIPIVTSKDSRVSVKFHGGSLIHLVKLFVGSFGDAFVHPSNLAFVLPFIDSFMHCFYLFVNYSFIELPYIFMPSCFRSIMHSFTQSLIYSFIGSFIFVFIHVFLHSFLDSFLDLLFDLFLHLLILIPPYFHSLID